jgi:YidC/Oxa1 family membrane protein insertase
LAEYKNPNQHGGKQDTNTLLMFTVVFVAILLGMQFLRPKHPATPAPAHTTAAKTNTSEPNSTAPAAGDTAAKAAPNPTAEEATAASTPKVAAATQSTTVIENELYRITFSNRGGEVTSWILKKYTNYDGKPLDLVHNVAAEKVGYPLSQYT